MMPLTCVAVMKIPIRHNDESSYFRKLAKKIYGNAVLFCGYSLNYTFGVSFTKKVFSKDFIRGKVAVSLETIVFRIPQSSIFCQFLNNFSE